MTTGMRRLFPALFLLLVGCAQRLCPSCPRCLPVESTSGSQEVAPPLDQREVERVVTSLFPKHLEAIRDCGKPKTEPKSWVEVDDLELANLDTGQFVPVVERRERGHYTDASDQIRYVIRIDNCQQNQAARLRVEAVFSEWALTPGSPADGRRPRPLMFREWRGVMPPRQAQ